jgi:putative aldouronate transport system substrate-binding protein
MKKKIFLGLALLVCLALTVFASGQRSGGAAQSASGVPTITWWLVGGDSAELAECVRLISEYTGKQIGVRLEIKMAGWGDQQQRFTTIINSGEYFDIMFDDLTDYSQRVAQGRFRGSDGYSQDCQSQIVEPYSPGYMDRR